jgi:DNA-binding Lrp family transcriptional regulator
MTKVKIDSTDRKILEILQKNAKITNAQLAQDIGLSPAPTLERVKKLEKTGIIDNYYAQVNPALVGLGVCTFVMLSLKGHNKKNIDVFLENIRDIKEIIECHHVTGSGDFILKIITEDIQSYQQLMLDRVSEIPVVDTMESMVVLSTFKDSKVLPIK